MDNNSGRENSAQSTRVLWRVAVLAISGLALAGCVVYPAGPPRYYAPHPYYYGDGGWGHRDWR